MRRGTLEESVPNKRVKAASFSKEEEIDIYDLNSIDLEEEEIQKLIEQQPEKEPLDESNIKRLLKNFSNVLENNTRQRIKHNNDPEKFLESEIALDDCLKQLQDISTTPQYFHLIDPILPELLSVLSHQNTDIAIDVVDLFRDFLSGGDDKESEKSYIYVSIFASNLLEAGVVEMTADLIKRLDEGIAEEKQGIYDILELFESLSEIHMEKLCFCIGKTQLVLWLLDRLKVDTFDDIKQYTSEVLCIFAQNSSEIQKKVGELDGIEMLLRLVASYRKEDPSSAEEEEMIENVFDIISIVSTHQENREKFFAAEGFQLMRIFIKAKKYCRIGAIKFLNFFLTNHTESVIKWIDIGGLGTLFKALLNSGSYKKKYKSISQDYEEGLLISTISNIITQIKENNDGYDEYLMRIAAKFKENSYEKLKKLLEVKTKLQNKVDTFNELDRGDGTEVIDTEYFTLQLIDSIIAFLENQDEFKEKIAIFSQ